METVRLIVRSLPNGENETMIFTDDLITPAIYHCKSGQIVDIDKEIEMELPSGFPLNYTFVKEL